MTFSSQLKTNSKFNLQYFINQGSKEGGDARLTFPKGKKMYIIILPIYRIEMNKHYIQISNLKNNIHEQYLQKKFFFKKMIVNT